ncbi:MAG: hypothetical protein AUK47_10235 [Deltaproteobacteria bacterium CG2_30_63_29]|nr:MAG: hypothetical protein AUK47_10235 [Deltaproteobacteria bacterium CG2_30_63_29]
MLAMTQHSRRLLSLLVTVLALCLPLSLAAQPVCRSLSSDAGQRYQQLKENAETRIASKSFDLALDDLRRARNLCADDVALELGLADVYRGLNDCNMARFWMERTVEHLRSNGGNSTQEMASALERLTEWQSECPESALLAVTGDEPEVSAELVGSSSTLKLTPFPFEGRLTPGDYLLKATRNGKQTLVMTLSVHANSLTVMHVPELLLEDVGGLLRVRCQTQIDQFEMGTEAEQVPYPCHYDGVLSNPKTFVRLEIDGAVDEEALVREPNHVADLRVPVPLRERDEFTTADWGWLAFGSGVVLLGTGVGLQLAALSMEADVTDPKRVDSDGNITSLTQAQAEHLLSRAEGVSVLGIGTMAVGGAALVTGVVLCLLPDDPYKTQLTPMLDNQSAGIQLYGVF